MSHMIVDDNSTDLDALREDLQFELIVLHTEVKELNKGWDFTESLAHQDGCARRPAVTRGRAITESVESNRLQAKPAELTAASLG